MQISSMNSHRKTESVRLSDNESLAELSATVPVPSSLLASGFTIEHSCSAPSLLLASSRILCFLPLGTNRSKTRQRWRSASLDRRCLDKYALRGHRARFIDLSQPGGCSSLPAAQHSPGEQRKFDVRRDGTRDVARRAPP